MSVQIYNTLTKKKEDLTQGNIKMYTCGVTVYDVCHIGHARSLYIFDVMVRYLKYRGYKVKFVRNITDIDDKIINKAKELGISAKEVAGRYIESYKRDLNSLGIEETNPEPRATENIPEMIRHVQGLIEKGFAYEIDGDVYFSVRKFRDYGKLSGQNLEQMMTGARIEKDERKQDPLDFALWKKSKEGEPSWNSPWGGGRPGWHIECSVMSSKFLKTETLDIHGGGRDLIFPHHENEIAQSEALTGKPFAKIWIHHGLLTINGQKMAKSLGNFVTIQDFIKKYKNPDILKLFFLSAHYSQPLDFTNEKIEEFKKQKISFDKFFDLANTSQPNRLKYSKEDKQKIDSFCSKFDLAMDNDFNTPQALASLFELIDFASARESSFHYAKSKLEKLFNILGLTIKPEPRLRKVVIEKGKERYGYKKNKEFDKADKIREEIKRDWSAVIADTGTNYSFIFIPKEEKNTEEKKDER